MASQITHIVYGKKIFEKLSGKLNWKEFAIGTTFPDIRQIAKLERNLLHKFNTSLGRVPKNSFDAGVYIHSYLDEKRQSFLERNGLDKILKGGIVSTSALKLVEDELLYDRIDNWREIGEFFNDFLDEELELVSREAVIKWHKFLQIYFSKKPDEKIWRDLLVNASSYGNIADEIIVSIGEIKKNKKAMNLLSQVDNIF